jgi:hypothetical protein
MRASQIQNYGLAIVGLVALLGCLFPTLVTGSTPRINLAPFTFGVSPGFHYIYNQQHDISMTQTMGPVILNNNLPYFSEENVRSKSGVNFYEIAEVSPLKSEVQVREYPNINTAPPIQSPGNWNASASVSSTRKYSNLYSSWLTDPFILGTNFNLTAFSNISYLVNFFFNQSFAGLLDFEDELPPPLPILTTDFDVQYRQNRITVDCASLPSDFNIDRLRGNSFELDQRGLHAIYQVAEVTRQADILELRFYAAPGQPYIHQWSNLIGKPLTFLKDRFQIIATPTAIGGLGNSLFIPTTYSDGLPGSPPIPWNCQEWTNHYVRVNHDSQLYDFRVTGYSFQDGFLQVHTLPANDLQLVQVLTDNKFAIVQYRGMLMPLLESNILTLDSVSEKITLQEPDPERPVDLSRLPNHRVIWRDENNWREWGVRTAERIDGNIVLSLWWGWNDIITYYSVGDTLLVAEFSASNDQSGMNYFSIDESILSTMFVNPPPLTAVVEDYAQYSETCRSARILHSVHYEGSAYVPELQVPTPWAGVYSHVTEIFLNYTANSVLANYSIRSDIVFRASGFYPELNTNIYVQYNISARHSKVLIYSDETYITPPPADTLPPLAPSGTPWWHWHNMVPIIMATAGMIILLSSFVVNLRSYRKPPVSPATAYSVVAARTAKWGADFTRDFGKKTGKRLNTAHKNLTGGVLASAKESWDRVKDVGKSTAAELAQIGSQFVQDTITRASSAGKDVLIGAAADAISAADATAPSIVKEATRSLGLDQISNQLQSELTQKLGTLVDVAENKVKQTAADLAERVGDQLPQK